MTRAPRHLLRIAALCLAPAMAMAHPGHGPDSSFVAGAMHPITGVDHLAGFIVVGILAARLGGRTALSMTAVFLGLLVAASTTNSDGWQYATGFMLSGASLVAAATFTTWAATRLTASATTATAPRSPTWAAAAAPAHRLCARR